MEIWKEIAGYEGYFEVSNMGNFRSKNRIVRYKQDGLRNYPGKPLKTETIVEGYQRIILMKEGVKKRFMCHRIVAQEFVPNPYNKPYVNHKDGNPANNRAENLEWCTQSENERHAVDTLGKTMQGKTFPKKVQCIETGIVYPSMNQCVIHLGNQACIEGLNKAIKAHRQYHGYTFVRV